MSTTQHPWPRIRDLPEHEQQAFKVYLIGQTRPFVEGLPQDEQDFFYVCDYRRWKAGLPVVD